MFSDAELIRVVVSTNPQIEMGKLPQEVKLEINYYQIDKEKKNVVNAKLEYNKFIELSKD